MNACMDKDVAEFAIDIAQKNGCEYAEARLEHSQSNEFILKNGIAQVSGFSEVNGLGVRFLHKGALGFISTDTLSKSTVKEQILASIQSTKGSPKFVNKLKFDKEKASKKDYSVKQKINFLDISPEEKIAELQAIDNQVAGAKAGVASRFFELGDSYVEKYITNTNGTQVFSSIPRISLFYMLTIQEGQKSNQRYWEKANVGGFERISEWNLGESLVAECRALQENILRGKPAPKGMLDVVVGPEISGIMAHESCGHPMEADRILGREAAQAGESFISQKMLGEKIGSSAVSVIDDPTIPGTYGYYLYDDEGVKARKKYLYKKGIINEFLHNRETASIMGVKSNGSSRASAFDREPILRMSNTFIEPGKYSEEELIEDIKLGVFMKNFTEWNIDDRRYQQKYVGAECYLIKNGRITTPVFGPALEITTPQLYSSIDACAKNIEYHPGNCGKGEPMQGIPVTLGGPSVRIKNLKLN